MAERWKPVPGYEGVYEVSDQGRVRSLDRVDTVGRRRRGSIRKLVLTPNGYAALTLCRYGAKTMVAVHQLVASAFIGEKPAGQHVCHNDGDKTNNRASNLRYDTPAGNNADKRKHGTWQEGSAVGTAKLTEAAVRDIRSSGEAPEVLAFRYGVCARTIVLAKRKETWRHV